MSKGLADLQATIASYQTSGDAINQYVSNYDKDFFDNWKAKVDLAKDKLESAQKLSDGVGEAYLGGKALQYSIKAFKNKYFNKDSKNPSDEDGKGDGQQQEGDTDPQGGEDSGTGNADDPDVGGEETLGDGEEVVNMGNTVRPTDTDVGGDSGFELQDMNTSSQPAQTGTDGETAESSFGDQASAQPTTTQDVQPEAEDFVQNPPPSQEMSQMGQSAEPDVSTSGGSGTAETGSSGLTETATQRSILESDPEAGVGGEVGGDIGADVGADIGADTAVTAATTAATEAGAGIGSAVLGGLGVAAEALGPIGLFAGIGIGLYELFHHPSKPPPPPKPVTASSKGEMVLPSYDAVIDTPASASAF